MLRFVSNARFLALCILLAPVETLANNLYISTNGTPAGPGTMRQPFDLITALSGAAGQPGDTFWLTGGNYAIGNIETKIQGAPGRPITFRGEPGEWARIDGSLNFFGSAGYVILQDLEFYSSNTNRASMETNVGFNPTDITNMTGIASYAPNMSFINLIVHDETGEGIYISATASNNLIYGCVIYNNGWRSPDNAEGHGIYMQGWNGGRVVENNIIFDNSGADLHIYENQTNYSLAGIRLIGNVAFNAGAIQNTRAYRDWIVGVDTPATCADQIVFEDNLGYFPESPALDDAAQIGRDGVNGSVALLDNYLPSGLQMNNWTIAAVSGNWFAAQPGHYAVTINQSVPLAAAWDDNTYVVSPRGGAFLANSNALDFSAWQSDTGFDSNSIYLAGNPTGTRVFVRTNYYEPGRANIIVYNWDNLTNVAVDVSSVLSPGAPFEARNAEDFFAPPVLSGVFTNQLLNLPMTGLTVAVPNGPMITPPPTGPTFNVFVLLPRLVRLQAAAVNGQGQISWPTNSGDWILQFTTNLSTDSAWAEITNAPAIVGDQYTLNVPFSGSAGFYRLQATP
jgi:Right handed beta helix region